MEKVIALVWGSGDAESGDELRHQLIEDTLPRIHHDIDVAVFPVIAARHRAENARVLHRIAGDDGPHPVDVLCEGFRRSHDRPPATF